MRYVDWDGKAARTLIDLILPSTLAWLDDQNIGGVQFRTQGLQYERYWHRALNQCIGADEIRDQAVVRDIQQWIKEPSAESALIVGLCSSEDYSNVWEDLAFRFFANDRERILLLCQQVLDRIRQTDKAAASSDSKGFVAVWRYGNRHVPPEHENAQWLQDRITEAAGTSLELVDSLWRYWGKGIHSIVRQQEEEAVRRQIIDVLKYQITTPDSLARITHPGYPYVLYQLVVDPGEYAPVLAGPDSWRWMGPILLEGIKSGQVTTGLGVCILVATRDGRSIREPTAADAKLLHDFFGNEAAEVIDSIERLIPQVPEKDRAFVTAIVESAQRELAPGDTRAIG